MHCEEVHRALCYDRRLMGYLEEGVKTCLIDAFDYYQLTYQGYSNSRGLKTKDSFYSYDHLSFNFFHLKDV